MKLINAKLNKEYMVVEIVGGHNIKNKFYSMGLNIGVSFKVIRKSTSGPFTLLVRGTKIAIGSGMVEKIIVKEKTKGKKMQKINIALAGNPNSGKTTIFNNLTGSRQHVGNYPGVTVEKKEGKLKTLGYEMNVVDLPGTYSLTAYSIEEIVTRNYIVDESPDVVVHVVDSSNLERNLYLAIQLMELKVPLILVFNMSDISKQRGFQIDIKRLSELFGVPIIETVGNKNQGTEELIKKIIGVKENREVQKQIPIPYNKEIEQEILNIVEKIKDKKDLKHHYPHKWIAIKLLEQDKEVKDMLDDEVLNLYVKERINKLENIYGHTPETIIADNRYGVISGACTETVIETVQRRHDISDKIDKIVTNKILGLPIFLTVMWFMFQWTFKLAEKPMQLLEIFFEWLGVSVSALVSEGMLQSLLVDGIIGGVGGVIIFLPNILLLFFFIALLEDSGYMARAAFVVDKIMHKIGLHGKSFIPMLIGFGCTVPAYMSSRILENKKDRLITMHINTFMSCGARLPVYVLFCGIFWPKKAGTVMFSIYVLGIVVALITAKVLRMTRFKGMSSPFIMELPIYRMPTIKSLLLHMWQKGYLYVKKAGTIILCASVIMWALMTFPGAKEIKPDSISKLKKQEQTLDIENTYAGKIGHFIEPVIKPLGFDWRIGVCLFTGVLAKEVVVSTLGTIYSIGEKGGKAETLKEKIKNDPKFSPLVAFAFMIFILIYFPCIAAMAVFLRETGSIKETLFQMTYTTCLAWILAFIVFQGGRLLGLG